MACGCVVVASDIGGLPEVVKDKEIGLLHKPESIDDISEKVFWRWEGIARLNNNSVQARNKVEKLSLNIIKDQSKISN